jgi:hypothetical protein
MSRIISCDHSLGQKDILKFILFFMIIFQCNIIIILSFIIFYMNYNEHIIDIRYFKIPQHYVRLSTSI